MNDSRLPFRLLRAAGVVLLAATLPFACSETKTDKGAEAPATKNEAHPEHGPNGGHLLEIGDHVAHLELVQDKDEGSMTLYLLGKDAKTALLIKKAPKVKLISAEGPKVLDTKAVGGSDAGASQWKVSSPLLKGKDAKGRISVEYKGKTYQPEIVSH
ncbi:MAG: hypothetical protein CSA62_11250 [Planctomycetota bacterium]|nr:MAG: hypothetical protein CSA62_11250 [Planctomycetota bacterium]